MFKPGRGRKLICTLIILGLRLSAFAFGIRKGATVRAMGIRVFVEPPVYQRISPKRMATNRHRLVTRTSASDGQP